MEPCTALTADEVRMKGDALQSARYMPVSFQVTALLLLPCMHAWVLHQSRPFSSGLQVRVTACTQLTCAPSCGMRRA